MITLLYREQFITLFREGKLYKLLLYHGASVSVRDSDGLTLLQGYLKHNFFCQVQIVRLLVNHGVDVKASCPYGSTLSLCERRNTAVIQYLESAGAN